MEVHIRQECKAIYELFDEIIHFHQLMLLKKIKFNKKKEKNFFRYILIEFDYFYLIQFDV